MNACRVFGTDSNSSLTSSPLLEDRPLSAMFVIKLVLIGLTAGLFAGMFGVGGAIIIVPALVYWVGFNQHLAIGTSAAILLPPIGLAAVLRFYKEGHVDFRAALLIAVPMFIAGYFGAAAAEKLSGPHLRLIFSVFILLMGIYLVYGACRRLGWI